MSNLLEQTLTLARGQSGLALVSNIMRVLRAPHAYAFGEVREGGTAGTARVERACV